MISTALVSQSDFIGFLALSQDKHQQADFPEFVKKEQTELFRELLTGALYADLVSDVNAPTAGTPSKQKYLDLFNGVNYLNDEEETVVVTGALEALRHFVYSSVIQQQPYKNTPSGTTVNVNENSEPLERKQLNVQTNQRYNKGVELYCELIEFVKFYTKFSTIYTSISEAPAGTYTVLLSDTTYLDLGDTIRIDNAEFVIDGSVTANTSIVFTSTAGQTFDPGGSIEWEPFKDVAPVVREEIYW